MDIQRAVPSAVKQWWGQHQPVGSHHQRGSICGLDSGDDLLRFQGWRLQDGQAVTQRETLDRTGLGPQTPAVGTVGLGEHQTYVVAGAVKAGERTLRELRGAGED